MEIERAKAICNVAQTVIDSARVEVKYMEVSGQGEKAAEKFFGPDNPELPVTFSTKSRLMA